LPDRGIELLFGASIGGALVLTFVVDRVKQHSGGVR
jgi:hypothetical protein